NDCLACNYTAGGGTSGVAVLSLWMMTPVLNIANGATFSFWTHTLNPAGGGYPDRLQIRMSLNGSSTNVGSGTGATGANAVGDFSNLLLDINPAQNTTAYPSDWTQFTVTISGVSTPTTGRLAFRYFVTGGGPGGANSNAIVIDNASYAVPAPGAIALLGLAGVCGSRRRRNA
ncbi:MAG TPA: choice-of-anchor J domain-containing protein, partial [Phycisphaerales bacterium]|nr:choice-of-anchor J domain-containing protein [Phycisphaerales bacterium]